MYRLISEESFDSAHFLSGYLGKCKNIHGHRWTIKIEVSGKELYKQGSQKNMLIDFNDLKKELRLISEYFDHSLIIEKGTLKKDTLKALKDEEFRIIELDFRPTAEEFARYFYNYFKTKNFNITKVWVYETPKNCAEYSEMI